MSDRIEEETPSNNITILYNAQLSQEYYTLTDKDSAKYRLSLPSIPLSDFTQKVKTLDDENIQKTLSQDWKKTVEDSVDYYTPQGFYQDLFTDPSASFKQGIEDEQNQLLGIQNLKFKKSEGELKGEIAILKVSRLLGLGDVFTIPLPHSGLWVTIKPPTESDLIEFYNNLYRDKIMLGRSTFGFTLTNFSVYINDKVFDFIQKHIHSTNNSEITKENLKSHLLIYDLPILAWGLACTMYPNGFDFQRACVNDVETCSYIAKGTVNPTKLLWIDNSALTPSQKSFLYEYRPNKNTLDGYNRFVKEHQKTKGSYFTAAEDLKIYLKIPTVSEHVSDGMRWITGINNSIEETLLSGEDDDETRVNLLQQYVYSSLLRQYSHFIEMIETEDGVIQDRETIDEVLDILSSNDEVRDTVINKVLEFKKNTVLGLVGIPQYECPQCGFNQNPTPSHPRFTNVIPLDVMNLFFTLIILRITRVIERA